jgi:hypothetical protein
MCRYNRGIALFSVLQTTMLGCSQLNRAAVRRHKLFSKGIHIDIASSLQFRLE